MSNFTKRIVTASAAILFTLSAGAGIASASNGGDYDFYCNKKSSGYNFTYCHDHFDNNGNRKDNNTFRDRNRNNNNHHDNDHHGHNNHH
ncbi:hypothetical protein JGU71_02815 [Antrihabitans sp. YC3-6]|uniref:Uncharacterized protein n=1 Tax=Antrihabitans stalagmiti TaxID=2799499 RepID=A0A934NME7_9NOCA|nr:hypothetical protein [Antrihabitans stalagmiti]MBJ8337807.1 hypothetical protein [Antrihabitans stalagmiti]